MAFLETQHIVEFILLFILFDCLLFFILCLFRFIICLYKEAKFKKYIKNDKEK